MMKRIPLWIALAIFSAAAICRAEDGPARPNTPGDNDTAYLFSFFRKNGEDGLYPAWSRDGLKWSPLNHDQPLVKPAVGREKLMRDPCIVRGPDGTFHMAWTPGWFERGIGLAHSKDLIHWSEQKYIRVMDHEPTARNAWAPEIFYDDATKRFLIIWASTIPGRFPATDSSGDGGLNHRMYYTTTSDFEAFAPTKLLYDGGFNVIDATIVKDGSRYVMILKDETKTPPRKDLRLAIADRAEGPYGKASDPFTVSWVEGPSAARLGDEWYVFYDEYTRGRYGAVRSKDMKDWQVVPSERLGIPKGARHGAILQVSGDVVRKLLDNDGKPQ